MAVEADAGLRQHHLGRGLGRFDTPVQRVTTLRQVEPWKRARAVAQHGHIETLEALERRTDIQDRLHTRAYDCDWRLTERDQIGGFVPGLARLAVQATQAPSTAP